MEDKKQISGWAKRNRFERICLILAIAAGAAAGILCRCNPLFMFHWAFYLLILLFFTLALLSTWRHIVTYERVCFIVLSAAATAAAFSLRLIFLSPNPWGMPIFIVSLSVILLMMGVLSWRKSRLEGILFVLLGAGYLLLNIGKWIYKLIITRP